MKMKNNEIDLSNYMISWIQFFLKKKPRGYQRKLLKLLNKFNKVCARWCRQTGKTTTIGWYVLFKATTVCKLSILIVAPAKRQSDEFYSRIAMIVDETPEISQLIISKTKSEMKFINGSIIRSLPSGHDGKTIRGPTADIIIIEESGYMKDSIITGVINPMLASKKNKGQLIKIGSPFGKNNFYFSCKSDKYVESFVDYRMALEEGAFSQEFIDDQRDECTSLEFRTEYEAEFIEDADCYFKTKVIEQAIMDYPMITDVYI